MVVVVPESIVSIPESVAAETQSRKADHLRICLDEDVQFRNTTNGLERYRFRHCCIPELNWDDIDLSVQFLRKRQRTPLLISSMTGGTEQAKQINQRLAGIAQEYGMAMGVGSQRVAVEKPQLADTFAVRSRAPDILLFANLGAVQLNYQYGLAQCQQVVELLEADALILHLNPLQECVQAEGDTNFRGLLDKIADLCDRLPVPVVAKEVGNGITAAAARKLIATGVAAIDVAGAGGTSWAKVESERAETAKQRRLGRTFADWGQPTAECIVEVRAIAPEIPLIASGGLRTGLDAAKALALGADLAGFAWPFLQAAAQSEAALHELADVLLAELSAACFCTGNATLADLRQSHTLMPIQ